MNRKRLIAIVAILLPLAALAQSAVTSAGGTVGNGLHSLSYGVGQVATGTAHAAASSLHEGVVQQFTVEDVSIAEGPGRPSPVTVYPNPAANTITLRRDGKPEAATVRIYATDGRLLRTEHWEGATFTLDIGTFAGGTYLLQAGGNTYKITKL